MTEILFHYQRVNITSWAYLSSLLMIALFFKFNRVWSLRNIDIIGLISFAPGLLLVQHGLNYPDSDHVKHIGYVWLFVVGVILLIRMLMDSAMVRRPLLEPNLSSGGLAFLAISLFCFLMANVVTGSVDESTLIGAQGADQLSHGTSESSADESFAQHGPGLRVLFLVPYVSTTVSTKAILGSEKSEDQPTINKKYNFTYVLTAKIMLILSQLAIVLGMVFIGKRNFDNIRTGIATAALYLMLPYTAMWTGDITHVLPAALLVWAIAMYRRPLLAGIFIGLSISVVYYALYLLPLWFSFYWMRGRKRFLLGVLIAITIVIISLGFTAKDFADFWSNVRAAYGFRLPTFEDEYLSGIWSGWNKIYRLPVLAIFLCMIIGLAFWPPQKNLGTLLSCSAAIMLGTQFWHPTTGGLAMAWYLPLVLLAAFRPNLEDRVANAVVATSWIKRGRATES